MERVDRIVQLYVEHGKTVREVGLALDVSAMTVSRALKQKGISARPMAAYIRKLSDREADTLVRRYLDGESSKKLAREFDVHVSTVANYVRRAGEELRGAPIRYPFEGRKLNEAAFDYCTDRSAYWTGHLMTERCVIESYPGVEPSIVLVFPQEEAGHAEDLKSFLRCSARAWAKKGPLRLRVASRILVDRLWELGVVSSGPRFCKKEDWRKSRNTWRGVVDGAGEVTSGLDKVEVSGDEPLLIQLATFIRWISPEAESELDDGLLVVRGDDARTLCRHIYSSCMDVVPRHQWIREEFSGE